MRRSQDLVVMTRHQETMLNEFRRDRIVTHLQPDIKIVSISLHPSCMIRSTKNILVY